MRELKLNMCYLMALIAFSCLQLGSAENKTDNLIACNISDLVDTHIKCPPNSVCTLLDDKDKNSARCICSSNFEFNKTWTAQANSNSSSDSTYCIKTTVVPSPSSVPSPTTGNKENPSSPVTSAPVTPSAASANSNSVTATTAKPSAAPTTTTSTTTTTIKPPIVIPVTPEPAKKPNTTDTSDDVKKVVEPESHHLFGGIVIPIFLVLLVIGSVFAVKRYDLVERARDVLRNRRYHANYESVGNSAIFANSDDDDDPPLI